MLFVEASGAGDGALSALLHDMSANRDHRARVPSDEAGRKRAFTALMKKDRENAALLEELLGS